MRRPDDDELDRRFPQIAWDRSSMNVVGRHNIVGRFSSQHRYDAIKLGGGTYTLCGARIPWLYITSGDSRRCWKCDSIATKKVASEQKGPREVARSASAAVVGKPEPTE